MGRISAAFGDFWFLASPKPYGVASSLRKNMSVKVHFVVKSLVRYSREDTSAEWFSIQGFQVHTQHWFSVFFLWFVIKNRVKRINKWYISKIFHGKIVQVKVKKMVQTEGKHFQMEKSWRTHIFYVNTTLFLLVMNYWIDLDSWLVRKFSKHCFFKDISNSFNRVTTLKCLI